MIGIISHMFKPSLVSRHTRMIVFKTFARLTLFCGSESWTVRTDRKRLL
jgi:hypothetical protein